MKNSNKLKKAGPLIMMMVLLAVTLSTAEETIESPIISEAIHKMLKTPITLRAQDASLSEVLKVLSQKSGMDFVAGEGVRKERITIILNKTPLDLAINLVVRAAGLSYEIIGNSVLIAMPDKLTAEVGRSAYVIRLKYAKAKEVAVMLSDLSGSVKIDHGGNRLICYTSPRVIAEMERIVKAIDHPHIQVMLETRVIEVSMDKLNDYGVDWAKLSPVTSGISHMEVPLKAGYNYNNWELNDINLPALLNILSQNGDARVLMNSKLTTTNNREAHLHIGEIIPYTVQSYNMSGSGGANKEIQKEEVGVKLTMTPHVNDDNEITLNIRPEVSSIVGFKGENNDVPHIRVRTTETSVRVKDKQTIFLAGLMSEEKSTDITKLPILGDIPLLGRIFQRRKNVFRKSNLFLEITPRIFFDADELVILEEKKTLQSPNAGQKKIEATGKE